jgi:hypothetical protein
VLRVREVQSTYHELIPAKECKVPRAEIMFVTIQRENIRPSKKEMNKAVTMQSKLPGVCSWAMNQYVFLSLTNRKSSVHLHALYSLRTALRTFTHRRVQLVICGQYRYLKHSWRSLASPRHTITKVPKYVP